MNTRFKSLSLCLLAILLMCTGCMEWDYQLPEDMQSAEHGLFISCEGNFQYSNASLSFYNPETTQLQNEIFIRANGFKLGDVAQSMVVRDGILWIIVNNSHVVFAIDANTYKEVGRIVNLPSPRYMHFISDEKAYITQLWDNRIIIVNPKTFEITGSITVPNMKAESGSTEQMVQHGKYVYCNCWSYQNRIIRIDTETDNVDAELVVGIQPRCLCIDRYGKLWTITDGGYEGSPYGYEIPRMFRIDADNFEIEREWWFEEGDVPRYLMANSSGDKIFWANDDVWQMDVTQDELPQTPLIKSRGTIYYGLTVSPYNGDVYVADAIDYQQPGKIYRYNYRGELLDEFYVGVIPGAFAWK